MNKYELSYTELVEGHELFDWNEFLNQEVIIGDSWQHARDLAGKWVTCACGAQCSVISRHDNGMPKDLYLEMYGLQFHGAIGDQNKEEAKIILRKIEIRSQFLIRQIQKQEQKNEISKN
jgi:hypothetical protein